MNHYEKSLIKELEKWHKAMRKPPAAMNKLTKLIQSKTQAIIPDKIQDKLTVAIQKMTETIMAGSGVLSHIGDAVEQMSLAESDWSVENAYKVYNRTAVAQGVGFGAGGILLGIADFPALLSIKVRFLFDCAKYYGYDTNDPSERLYILYIFQLAFCGDEHRLKVYNTLMNWDSQTAAEVNWKELQIEYRDYIDLAKLLQLLPVVGAVAGGAANFHLLEKLKVTAMNCYRSRYLQLHEGHFVK